MADIGDLTYKLMPNQTIWTHKMGTTYSFVSGFTELATRREAIYNEADFIFKPKQYTVRSFSDFIHSTEFDRKMSANENLLYHSFLYHNNDTEFGRSKLAYTFMHCYGILVPPNHENIDMFFTYGRSLIPIYEHTTTSPVSSPYVKDKQLINKIKKGKGSPYGPR